MADKLTRSDLEILVAQAQRVQRLSWSRKPEDRKAHADEEKALSERMDALLKRV